jgi:ATP-dependent DNA helicase RecG
LNSRPEFVLAADSPVDGLPGVGPRRAGALQEVGFETVADLLFHLPLRYEDKRAVQPLSADGPPSRRLYRLRLTSISRRRGGRGGRLHLLQAGAEDEAGTPVTLRWFNQRFRLRGVGPGTAFYCFGYAGTPQPGPAEHPPGLVIDNPELEPAPDNDLPLVPGPHLGRIIPVYRRVGGIGSRIIRAALYHVLGTGEGILLRDTAAAEALLSHGFPARDRLIRGLHCPPAGSFLESLNNGTSVWHRGLAFEELYLQQRELAEKKRRRLDIRKRSIDGEGVLPLGGADLLAAMEDLTGFRLSSGQQSAIVEIIDDMDKPYPMRRLLQGEVGCGKTVVAYAALFHSVSAGRQAALMAPTEALAWQHFNRLQGLLRSRAADQPLRLAAERIILVTGGIDAGQRRALETRLAGAGALIAIGTHALLSSAVVFRDLALAVVDEQQRFGVEQRERLIAKGANPDQLVISATPIPRTLGLRLCGDMELSRIRHLPLGRRKVRTLCLEPGQAAIALDLLEKELDAGRQGFVVCPTVRGRGGLEKRAAETVYRKFRSGRLARHTAGLLHGGMALDAARDVMKRFEGGELRVLVTTSVVEVGLDVARATVMIVLEPERFGLSQLHQLRGRIGRGTWPGTFIMLRSGDDTKGEAGRRLAVLATSDDGFHIAEEDLRLRGSGELTGLRQAGAPDYCASAAADDVRLLSMARTAAFRKFGLDVDDSEATDHEPFRRRVKAGGR